MEDHRVHDGGEERPESYHANWVWKVSLFPIPTCISGLFLIQFQVYIYLVESVGTRVTNNKHLKGRVYDAKIDLYQTGIPGCRWI